MTASLLQDYLSASAARNPDATALVMDQEHMSYLDLETTSNQIAHVLIEAGCRPQDRVCVLAEKSPWTIAAMLAALKAGCAYVPVDLASPSRRIGEIIRLTDPTAIVVTDGGFSALTTLRHERRLAADIVVIGLDEVPDDFSPSCRGPVDIAQASSEPPIVRATSTDPAHVLFTSGSSGMPKGVVVSHASVTNFIDWAVPHFGMKSDDRISGHPPLHFDLSTFDLYGALRAGAELHLVPPHTVLPQQLARFIETSALTQLFCVPSAMTFLSTYGAIPDNGFPALKRVLWCGEVLPTPVLREWMRRLPTARFTNLYGPTEATIASSFHAVTAPPNSDTEVIPIGTACDGEELLVLDNGLQELPPGTTGMLYIGGAGLSTGYWRDPAETARAFIADPRPGHDGERLYHTGDLARLDQNGVVHFLGRQDSQIKSRGYRIELGEVEAAISALAPVAECVVLGLATDTFEGATICCAYQANPESDTEPLALRASLAELLPAYMVPRRWMTLDQLPKLLNGKVDRRNVAEMFRAEAADRS